MKIKPIIKKKETPVPTEDDAFPPMDPDKDIIISFDVGIINLAYCIMSWDEQDGLKIYDWNIINMANGNPELTCSAIIKSSGKKCTSKAYYSTGGSGRSKKTTKGQEGYCITHGKSHMKTTDVPLQRNVTVSNVTEHELKLQLFRALDANPIFLRPTTVLVEQQLNEAREKIKSVEHGLFDYFVLRGVLDNEKIYNCLTFINAKNKLTVYDGPPISCHLKTQTPRNKWYAVRYCAWILRNEPFLLDYFEKFPQKKDDLADCMLQGLWYLKFHQEGKKAPLTSNHQKLVYGENNIISYNKVRPHAPSAKSIKSGKLTLSNIKYYLLKNCEKPDCLSSCIEFYFSGITQDSKFPLPAEIQRFKNKEERPSSPCMSLTNPT